ncbi:hypothetical protein JQX13_21625 [Archangium violaceum]|uniref:hypothetical protein n=1 Tax=Archangium violaceum TaxID=83451 RepID=UPI00193BBEC0|nr:hypothetical protein [Archangium violaceum]QRK12391.1 hypothetical protein JQX13_21625 [Archangium violaceum]
MNSRTQASRWGWTCLLLGALALAACGVAPEPPEEEAREESVSAMQDDGGGPSPAPTWSEPSFASGSVVASDGNQFLVVWRDVGRPGQLYAARVSKHGRLLDPEALRLNPAPEVEAGDPAVAFDGGQFLVVWQGQFSLFLVRVERDGTVVDSPPLPIADIFGSPAPAPALACAWRQCLVAWLDFADPGSVRGALLRTDDTGLGTQELTISSPAEAVSSFGISAAWTNNHFLVVWSDARFGGFKLLASRVRSDGRVLDPDGIRVSDSPGDQTFMDVVGTKRGFLVAWSDSRNGPRDIFGTRVRLDGSVPDPDGFPLSIGPGDDIIPALAYDGQWVLATWSRLAPDRGSTTIRGNLVRPHGTVATPDGFLLSGGEFVREVDQDVVFGSGKYFMAYGGAPTVDEPPFQVILGTRLRRDGTRVDDPAIRISHSPSVEGTTVAPVEPVMRK